MEMSLGGILLRLQIWNVCFSVRVFVSVVDASTQRHVIDEPNSLCFFFGGASSFDGNLASWNTDRVNTMKGMFQGASAFNGDVREWNVSKVEDFRACLSGPGLLIKTYAHGVRSLKPPDGECPRNTWWR